MGRYRENPLSIEAVGQLEGLKEEDITDLAKKVESADNARDPRKNRWRKLIEQRYGVRNKGKKNIPWPGANDDSWPVTDPVIRRWSPAVANLVLQSEPVCQFVARRPDFIESARPAQEFYHWLFLNHMDRVPYEILELVDNIAQFGVGYTRQGWDYRTERHSRVVGAQSLFPQGIEPAWRKTSELIQRQGQQPPDVNEFVQSVLVLQYDLDPDEDAEQLKAAANGLIAGNAYVRLVYECVLNDKPAFQSLSPFDVIRPTRGAYIEDDPFITIVHRMGPDEIRQKANDGFFRKNQADKVLQKIERQPTGDSETSASARNRSLLSMLDDLDGVGDSYLSECPIAEIWEIYAFVDINGDGLRERAVIWYHNSSRTLLSAFEYPFPFRDWPISEFEFEHHSKRALGSRGIAELLKTFQKKANTLHNSRLDAAQILLSPMFKVRSIGNQFSRNIRFRPGGRIPVNEMTDFEPVAMDMRGLVEFLREEQLTKTLAEQLIGIFDPSLTQLGQSGRERRTATEVDAVVSQATEVHSHDASLFQLGMAKVHRQLWDLWEEFGQDEISAKVLGSAVPRIVTKAEIAGDYDIVPAGTPLSTNKAIIFQRARELLALAMQDESMVLDKYEVWREYLGSLGYTYLERMLRSPEELQVLQEAVQTINQANDEMKRGA